MAGPGVSGPGSLSRRTDRGPAQKIATLPDAQYGEAATYRDLQKQAPLAQTPSAPPPSRPSSPGRGVSAGGAATGVTPIHAPTQNPDEPVTAGVDSGPGVGSAALGPILSQSPAQQTYQNALSTLQQVATLSRSSEIQALLGQLQTRM